MFRRLWESKWLWRAVLAAVLVIVGYAMGSSLLRLSAEDFTLEPKDFVLAFICALLGHLTQFANWMFIAASFGVRMPWLESGNAYFYSRLGRYVPGKVALVLMRFKAYSSHSKRAVSMAMGVDYVSSCAGACLVVLAGVVGARGLVPPFVRYTALAFTPLFLLTLYPPILEPAVNFLFRKAGRPPLEQFPSFPIMMCFVAAKCLGCLIHGLAFFLLLRALAPIDFSYYFVTTGTFFAAGLIGMAAFFAPRGIGVTEGVLYLVLPAFLPRPAVVVGAVLIRVIVSVTELLLAGVFALLGRQANVDHSDVSNSRL
ncbi:MAG TPA: hypothetical protein PKY01_00270 [Candidatus Hydrogenedentes bacterium]|nr:hypothetical protein [Candidatus Hydrogenedentota bacterium]